MSLLATQHLVKCVRRLRVIAASHCASGFIAVTKRPLPSWVVIIIIIIIIMIIILLMIIAMAITAVLMMQSAALAVSSVRRHLGS